MFVSQCYKKAVKLKVNLLGQGQIVLFGIKASVNQETLCSLKKVLVSLSSSLNMFFFRSNIHHDQKVRLIYI